MRSPAGDVGGGGLDLACDAGVLGAAALGGGATARSGGGAGVLFVDEDGCAAVLERSDLGGGASDCGSDSFVAVTRLSPPK
jgi:hypothetical protein